MNNAAPIFTPLDNGHACGLICPRAQNYYAAIPSVMAGTGSAARRNEMLHGKSARASARVTEPCADMQDAQQRAVVGRWPS